MHNYTSDTCCSKQLSCVIFQTRLDAGGYEMWPASQRRTVFFVILGSFGKFLKDFDGSSRRFTADVSPSGQRELCERRRSDANPYIEYITRCIIIHLFMATLPLGFGAPRVAWKVRRGRGSSRRPRSTSRQRGICGNSRHIASPQVTICRADTSTLQLPSPAG